MLSPLLRQLPFHLEATPATMRERATEKVLDLIAPGFFRRIRAHFSATLTITWGPGRAKFRGGGRLMADFANAPLRDSIGGATFLGRSALTRLENSAFPHPNGSGHQAPRCTDGLTDKALVELVADSILEQHPIPPALQQQWIREGLTVTLPNSSKTLNM